MSDTHKKLEEMIKKYQALESELLGERIKRLESYLERYKTITKELSYDWNTQDYILPGKVHAQLVALEKELGQ